MSQTREYFGNDKTAQYTVLSKHSVNLNQFTDKRTSPKLQLTLYSQVFAEKIRSFH